ncbi:MAG: hypothetical protein PVH54_07255 [Gammaproteobacteria bacterium]
MKTIIGIFLIAALFVVSRAEAVTVQYLLSQTNPQGDDTTALLVTISDLQAGQLDFQVETKTAELMSLQETQPAFTGFAGMNNGIFSFGFQLEPGVMLAEENFQLPENWKVQFNKGMGQAGKFDVRLRGPGNREDPLEFSIVGLGLEDIIPGFASLAKADGSSGGFFSGDELVAPVPVPAALWLFGSGVLLLGRIATRRRA